MTTSSLTPDLTPEALAARYSLLCRATCPPDADNPAQRELNALQNLIEQQLPALARHYCPPGFADTWLGLKAELQRLREFCACPALAHKTLIAFGGGFSAGKSSLINALIGEKRLLPAQVDPTTSLPTYLMHGPAHAIHALNQYRRLIELSPEEFASLTHDEQARFGSSAARLLEATYLTHPSFAWQNLAFIDTPGYSKPDDAHASRSDAQLARAWLNSAHAIVWAVSAEAGCISEDDLAFLATLNPDIPRIVVVTKADKKTEKDVADIAELIKKTMAGRNLSAREIFAVSARKKDESGMGELEQWLKEQEAAPPQAARFADAFYGLYGRYAQQLKDEQAQLQESLDEHKRAAAITENAQVAMILIEDAQKLEKQLERYRHLDGQLDGMTEKVYDHLHAAGRDLEISVTHLTLSNPKGRLALKREDVPEEIMEKVIEFTEDSEIIKWYDPSSWSSKRQAMMNTKRILSIISQNAEKKLKLQQCLRNARNVLAIHDNGGKVGVRKKSLMYAGKDYLSPLLKILFPVYDEIINPEKGSNRISQGEFSIEKMTGCDGNSLETAIYFMSLLLEDPDSIHISGDLHNTVKPAPLKIQAKEQQGIALKWSDLPEEMRSKVIDFINSIGFYGKSTEILALNYTLGHLPSRDKLKLKQQLQDIMNILPARKNGIDVDMECGFMSFQKIVKRVTYHGKDYLHPVMESLWPIYNKVHDHMKSKNSLYSFHGEVKYFSQFNIFHLLGCNSDSFEAAIYFVALLLENPRLFVEDREMFIGIGLDSSRLEYLAPDN